MGVLFVTHLSACRIIAGWCFLGQDFGYPEANFEIWYPPDDTGNKYADVQGDHWKVIREIVAASVVPFFRSKPLAHRYHRF